MWRGQVFSTHSPSPELSKAFIGDHQENQVDSNFASPCVHLILPVCTGTCNTKLGQQIVGSLSNMGPELPWLFWENPYSQEVYFLVRKLDNKVLNKQNILYVQGSGQKAEQGIILDGIFKKVPSEEEIFKKRTD